MLDFITTDQLEEWKEYFRLEPFGEQRADLRMGTLASIIANVNRDPKKSPRPWSPSDFITDFVKAGRRYSKKLPLLDREGWNSFMGGIKAAVNHKDD